MEGRGGMRVGVDFESRREEGVGGDEGRRLCGDEGRRVGGDEREGCFFFWLGFFCCW